MNKQTLAARIRTQLQTSRTAAQDLRSMLAGALDENDFTEDEEETLDNLDQAQVDTYLEQVYAILAVPTEKPLDWTQVHPDTIAPLVEYANFIASATFRIIYDEGSQASTLKTALTLLQQNALYLFTANVNQESMSAAMQECYENKGDWNKIMVIALAFCGDPTKSIEGWEAYGPRTLAFFDNLLGAQTGD